MTVKDKPLGIQQRIPLDILNIALQDELKDGINEVRIKELLQTEYQGSNRVNKTLVQIKTIIANKSIMDFIKVHKEKVLNALNSNTDKNLILIALICARYPFCYDVIVIMSKQFRLQDTINTPLLMRLVGDKYGSNKSCENSVYSTIPQFIEAGLFFRPTNGVYEFNEPLKYYHEITFEIWKECFYMNEPLSNREDVDNLYFEPFFRFIDK